MARDRDRTSRLAARVRWLDRYRRLLAIVAAVILAPLSIARLARLVGAEYPEINGIVLSVVVGMFTWWIVEVALAWLTAVWETECMCLRRDAEIPRAIWLRR